MSVSTKLKLRGNVSPEAVIEALKTIYPNTTDEITNTRFIREDDSGVLRDDEEWARQCDKYRDDAHYVIKSGFIDFDTGREGPTNIRYRSVFYVKSSINSHENLEYYVSKGLADNDASMVGKPDAKPLTEMLFSETTSLSLGCYDVSVEIMLRLIAYFGGGWLDENDCDNIEYEWVSKAEALRRLSSTGMGIPTVNTRNFFKKDFHRAFLKKDFSHASISESEKRKYKSHFSRFVCEKYELLFHVHTSPKGTPYVYAVCHKTSGSSRYTPHIYINGEEGVFGGDDAQRMQVTIETTSYGALPVEDIKKIEEEFAYARKVAEIIMDDFIKPILKAGNDLSETGLLLDMPKGFELGDEVRTPRFLNVRIEETYESVEMMRSAGYTEPTHLDNDDVEICGKNIGEYRMEFAAAKKGTQ